METNLASNLNDLIFERELVTIIEELKQRRKFDKENVIKYEQLMQDKLNLEKTKGANERLKYEAMVEELSKKNEELANNLMASKRVMDQFSDSVSNSKDHQIELMKEIEDLKKELSMIKCFNKKLEIKLEQSVWKPPTISQSQQTYNYNDMKKEGFIVNEANSPIFKNCEPGIPILEQSMQKTSNSSQNQQTYNYDDLLKEGFIADKANSPIFKNCELGIPVHLDESNAADLAKIKSEFPNSDLDVIQRKKAANIELSNFPGFEFEGFNTKANNPCEGRTCVESILPEINDNVKDKRFIDEVTTPFFLKSQNKLVPDGKGGKSQNTLDNEAGEIRNFGLVTENLSNKSVSVNDMKENFNISTPKQVKNNFKSVGYLVDMYNKQTFLKPQMFPFFRSDLPMEFTKQPNEVINASDKEWLLQPEKRPLVLSNIDTNVNLDINSQMHKLSKPESIGNMITNNESLSAKTSLVKAFNERFKSVDLPSSPFISESFSRMNPFQTSFLQNRFPNTDKENGLSSVDKNSKYDFNQLHPSYSSSLSHLDSEPESSYLFSNCQLISEVFSSSNLKRHNLDEEFTSSNKKFKSDKTEYFE